MEKDLVVCISILQIFLGIFIGVFTMLIDKIPKNRERRFNIILISVLLVICVFVLIWTIVLEVT